MEESASQAARKRLNSMLANEGIANEDIASEGLSDSGKRVKKLTFEGFWQVWKKFVLDQSVLSDRKLLFCVECIASDEDYDRLCFCCVVQFSVTKTNTGYTPLEQMGCNLYYYVDGSIPARGVLSSEGFLCRSDDDSSLPDFFGAVEDDGDIKKLFTLSASEMTSWDTGV